MRPAELAPLRVLLKVIERRSFARAAAELGLAAPTVSQSVRALEARLGVQLLRRTTRSVAPTPAGERLAARLVPLLGELDATLDEASGGSGRVRGELRLSVPRLAMLRWVAPWLAPFSARHPDVRLEISVDDALVDLARDRFDAGIRLGERVSPEAVAVALGGPLSMAAVASPAYFAAHGVPRTPRDLARHRCINQRLPTRGNVYRWEFERHGRPVAVTAGGPAAAREGGLVVNDTELAIAAAVAGCGVAFVFRDLVEEHLRAGRLVRALEAWCPPFAGLYFYYAKHHRPSPALRALVAFVRASARGAR